MCGKKNEYVEDVVEDGSDDRDGFCWRSMLLVEMDDGMVDDVGSEDEDVECVFGGMMMVGNVLVCMRRSSPPRSNG